MKNWLPFHQIMSNVITIRSADERFADQSPPDAMAVFQAMTAICAVAEPEDAIETRDAGRVFPTGACVFYVEREGEEYQTMDPWFLTISLGASASFQMTAADGSRSICESDDEPFQRQTCELLARSWWRPLNKELLGG